MHQFYNFKYSTSKNKRFKFNVLTVAKIACLLTKIGIDMISDKLDKINIKI